MAALLTTHTHTHQRRAVSID